MLYLHQNQRTNPVNFEDKKFSYFGDWLRHIAKEQNFTDKGLSLRHCYICKEEKQSKEK